MWEVKTDMRKGAKKLLLLLAGGLAIGCGMLVFLGVFESALPKAVCNLLEAPAKAMGWVWHQLGLPPRTEAAFAMPIVFVFAQWFVVGLLLAWWRYRIQERRTKSLPGGRKRDPEQPRIR